MEYTRSKIGISQIILAQLIAISIWMLITILQWANNPKSSPGLAIPLIVRSAEAISVFLISGILIFINEKIRSDKRKSQIRLLLIFIIYCGALLANLISLGLRKIIGYAPPRIEGYFFIQSLHFYIPIFLVLILYGITKNRIEIQIERENKLKAEGLAQQAKWIMLRYQVNPHFLFNALNTIRALIGVNDEDAKKIVTEMSDYFRYSLSSEEKETITIEEEINAALNYLKIQKIRFQDKLVYEINIYEDSKLCYIPFFTIQTLVENAIKYGLKTSNELLKIIIESKRINNDLDIYVKNSGKIVLQNGESTNKGISNLKERLNLLYPNRSNFELYEEDDFVISHIYFNLKM